MEELEGQAAVPSVRTTVALEAAAVRMHQEQVEEAYLPSVLVALAAASVHQSEAEGQVVPAVPAELEVRPCLVAAAVQAVLLGAPVDLEELAVAQLKVASEVHQAELGA